MVSKDVAEEKTTSPIIFFRSATTPVQGSCTNARRSGSLVKTVILGEQLSTIS